MSAKGGQGSPHTFIFTARLLWASSAQSASARGIYEWRREGTVFTPLTSPKEVNWKNTACVVCMVSSSNGIVWGVGGGAHLLSVLAYSSAGDTLTHLCHPHSPLRHLGGTLSSNGENVEFNQGQIPLRGAWKHLLIGSSCWHPCHLFQWDFITVWWSWSSWTCCCFLSVCVFMFS